MCDVSYISASGRARSLKDVDLSVEQCAGAAFGGAGRGEPAQGSLGAAILKNITKGGFAGEIGLVNPRYGEIAGVKSVSHIDKLPFGPELVVVTAPALEIPGIIDSAGRRGAAGAVIVSAGLGHGPGSISEATERAARAHHMA